MVKAHASVICKMLRIIPKLPPVYRHFRQQELHSLASGVRPFTSGILHFSGILGHNCIVYLQIQDLIWVTHMGATIPALICASWIDAPSGEVAVYVPSPVWVQCDFLSVLIVPICLVPSRMLARTSLPSFRVYGSSGAPHINLSLGTRKII